MKKLLIIIFLFCAVQLSATNYYVKTGGSDSASGLSDALAWGTISKVNSFWAAGSFVPGDQILFNKGDSFYGTIIISKSGTSGNPITLGAYGTGANPIITGFTTITSGWTYEGGSIYSKVISSEALTNMVLVDDVQVPMGRWPDTTWNTYESFSTNTSITDTGLGTLTNWTGAEAVIKKNQFHVDRCNITNHTGDVLTYTSLGSTNIGTTGYGYFIQNDLRCVTATNEWFHDYTTTGKLYIYGDPSSKVIKVATLIYLVYNNGYDYITYDGIDFVGSTGSAVTNANTANYITFTNCHISFSGRIGFYVVGSNATATNNVIEKCNNTAIFANGANYTVTHNTINKIGLIVGQTTNSEYDLSSGIYSNIADGGLIQYNTIKNICYNGTFTGPFSVTIQYNFIDSTCVGLTDGGGIYLTNPTASVRTVDHNIITNVIGGLDGTVVGLTNPATGIYLDDGCTNVVSTNNTVANCSGGAVHIHDASANTFTGNTFFNNKRGIWFQNNTGLTTIFDNILTNNVVIAKTGQRLILFSSDVNQIPLLGTMDNNILSRPADETTPFYYNQPSTGEVSTNLAGWKSFTGLDASSTVIPFAVSSENDMILTYNATYSAVDKNITDVYKDLSGTEYNGTITLQPYTSKILFYVSSNLPPVIRTKGLSAGNSKMWGKNGIVYGVQ